MRDICSDLRISLPKLQKEFDKIIITEGVQCVAPFGAINIEIDAVFFGRKYGFLCFHDTQKVIYFAEIKTETVADLRKGLIAIKQAGFKISSITIDGRRGAYEAIKKILGNIPIQMCLFHQKAIVRRYITDKPKSDCGKELKNLMHNIINADQKFIDDFNKLKEKYKPFLNERNYKGDFAHQHLRAAFRSLENNLYKIFTYSDIPQLKIPNTNNHLEGLFGHLKSNLKIHRGLNKNRKKNAIKFFLKFFNIRHTLF